MFVLQLDSFFIPTIGLMSDMDISNYTLNQSFQQTKDVPWAFKRRRCNQEDGILQAKRSHTLYVRNHEDPAAGSALAKKITSL